MVFPAWLISVIIIKGGDNSGDTKADKHDLPVTSLPKPMPLLKVLDHSFTHLAFLGITQHFEIVNASFLFEILRF